MSLCLCAGLCEILRDTQKKETEHTTATHRGFAYASNNCTIGLLENIKTGPQDRYGKLRQQFRDARSLRVVVS
jgi:hypothetical protein